AGVVVPRYPRPRSRLRQPTARRAARGAAAGVAELYPDLAAADRADRFDHRDLRDRVRRVPAAGDSGIARPCIDPGDSLRPIRKRAPLAGCYGAASISLRTFRNYRFGMLLGLTIRDVV